jgi:Flp pilus assembly protein TadG
MGKGFLGKFIKGAKGSVAVMTAMGMVAIVGVASLAIDMGRLYTVRGELQNSADAAALAAVGNLIQDQGGVVVRDASAATGAASTVAQRQSQLSGLPAVPLADRTDLTIIFGVYNLQASSPSTAWDEIGTSCGSDSNANAVRITLRRASGLAYGAVTNLMAGVFGIQTSEVAATATAYLGYTSSAQTGTVNVPLAIPASLLTAANPQGRSWFASLFCSAAIASGPNQVIFKDLGSNTFYQSNLSKPQFDTAKAYMFVVNNADSLPSTVVNNLKKNYTSGTPIRPMARGTRLYPMSEYQWASNIKTIFQTFKDAYTAKKNASTGKWRVCVPVYADHNPMASRLHRGLINLARLISPGAPEALACFTFWNQTYQGGNVPIYVNGFANVDITNVTYTSGCSDCGAYAPATDGHTYLNQLDCMVNSSLSCRNANSVTVEIPVDSSTVSPPGSLSGGPSNHEVNPGAPADVGAIASIPRLVQ